MRYRYFAIVCFLLHNYYGIAQSKWSLQTCIEYALKNNTSIKEAGLQTRFSALAVSQNASSQWPSLNFSTSSGYRLGLSENPTTGTLQSSNFFSTGFNLSAGVTLFNWFAKRNTIRASELLAEADKMAMKKAEADIVLNVSAAYLQALLAKELITISVIQIQQTVAQTEVTRKKISAGVLSELDAAQVRLQLITDSSALVASEEAGKKTLLQLKAVLNLDAAMPFDVEALPVEIQSYENLLDWQPEALYASAFKNLPAIKQIDYQLEAELQTIKAAKAARYPSFSLYGSVGSNYVNIPSAQTFTYIPQGATGATVLINGTSYEVLSPSYKAASYGVTPMFRQLQKNFGQNIGLSVTIPIFNGKSITTNWKREELNFLKLKLEKDRLSQELKTTIYIAYSEALASFNKVKLSKKMVTESDAVLNAGQKRYQLNLLSTQDLLISQNNLQKVKTDLFLAEYDLIFKIKLLEFYSIKR